MPKRYKRYRSYSRAGEIQGAIWLIGLGILFLTGKWWPGIIIVIGLSMVAGALAREWGAAEPVVEPPPPPPAFPAAPPPASPPAPAFQAAPQPTPAAPPVRSARLPDLCPNCGAPPRTLAQRGGDPGLCPYCGSDIGVG